MDKFNSKTVDHHTAHVTAITGHSITIDNPKFSNGDLGKIQKILFGQQLRANTEQYSHLYRDIDERLSKLSDTCQQKFIELEADIDNKIESLKSVQNERDKAYQAKLTAITHNHVALETSFTEKLEANSDSSAQVQHQLTNKIEKSSAVFSDTLDITRIDLTNMLEAAILELQAQKLDRTDLSNLLGTVATQLNDGNNQPTDGTNGDNKQQPHQLRTGKVDGTK